MVEYRLNPTAITNTSDAKIFILITYTNNLRKILSGSLIVLYYPGYPLILLIF